MVPITGNTYPVRGLLRCLGGVWDKEAKHWLVPEDKAQEARRLAASNPVKPKKKFQWTKRKKARPTSAKKAVSTSNKLRTICSDCKLVAYLDPRALGRAKKPRCQACGGPLNLPHEA